MTTPQFTPHSDSPLYILDTSEPDRAMGAVAFLPFQGTSQAPLTLVQTWTDTPGIYLFFKALPANLSPIADRVRSLLRDPALRQTRFLWVENPDQPLSQWQFTALAIARTSNSDTGTVPRLTFVQFRNYALAIARGIECRLNPEQDGFTLNPGTSFPANTDPFYFSTDYGAHRLKGVGQPIRLSFTGKSAGCLTFDLTLSSSTESFDELIQMDVALRMFFKAAGSDLDANDPLAGFKLAGFEPKEENFDKENFDKEKFDKEKFLVSSHRYPFLGEQGDAVSRYQPLTLYAALDPLQPLNGDRTYFAFAKPGQEGLTSLSLPSCYRTNLGYTIHVTPHGHEESRLIFAERPSQNANVFDAPFYLVPTGKYTLSVPDYDKTPVPDSMNLSVRDDHNFLCGLAGIEYIQLSSQHTNILHLTPGQSAFAPDFVPGTIIDTDKSEQRLETLNSKATTAWAYVEHVEAEKNPIYFSQPKQSLLYKASNNLLSFLEVPVTGLPAGEYLPLFPYGGVTGKLTYYQQMEEQLLNPQRRERIRLLAKTDNTPLSTPSSETPPTEPLRALAMRVDDTLEANTVSEASAVSEASTVSEANAISEANATPEAIAMEARAMPQAKAFMVSNVAIAGESATPALAALGASADSIIGTTPQGLLATYSPDFELLNTLLLAKDTAGKDLNLQGLERRSSLRAAFQSSQLFLVITDPNSLRVFDKDDKNDPKRVLKEYFPDNQLTIQGWTFDLNPEKWRQDKKDDTNQDKKDSTNTVLIFKFLDKSLLDALKDTALWEQPNEFVSPNVTQVRNVRDRLVKLFEGAIATADDTQAPLKERASAATLADIARNVSWSGMVALNAPLSPGGSLPKELKALESGITGDFYAQYVGSNGTPVAAVKGQLQAKQSSLFGLIDYQDTSIPKTEDSGFAFQVASLRVQFQNSQITDFSSEINLTLDKLFGEATLLLNSRSRRNIVILKGFTEVHDGVITYGFSFSGENYFALPNSHIFNTIDIVKATFSSDDNAVGRFTLWGRFNFRKLDAIDLFSFGMNAAPGLNFNDYKEDPGKLALQALEVLDRKETFENRIKKLPTEDTEIIQKLTEAQGIVKRYDTYLRSGEEIRVNSEIGTSYSPAVQKICDDALNVIQKLRSLDPAILSDNDETVRRAVKATTINQTVDKIAKNEQFLLFSKLLIIMSPKPGDAPTFEFDPSQIIFDIDKSKVRPHSFHAKFPLKLVNFVHLNPDPKKSGTQPKGYLPVKTPLGSSSMPPNGFGLTFDLNLGSLGALSGSAKFVAQVLLVWQPNSDGKQEKATTFVGLKLPGLGGDVLGFPLQSVLKLSFKSVELIVDRSNPASAAYLLKIKKIALKLFVLSFPPNGQTELVIFGNPDATATNDAIGWYAAYAKEKPALPEGQSSGRASPTTARQ